MSILTAIMGLVKGVDSDDSENYLAVGLAGSLDKLDGHRHGDGTDGRPVTALANGAVGQGLLDIGGVVRASGSNFPTSGAGTILYFDGGKGEVFAQNADAHVLLPLRLNNVVWIYPSGGVYIGTTPSDPGQNNLVIQGTLDWGGQPLTTVVPVRQTTLTATGLTGSGNARTTTPVLAGLPATATMAALTFIWTGPNTNDSVLIYDSPSATNFAYGLFTPVGGANVVGSVLMPVTNQTIDFRPSVGPGTWGLSILVTGYTQTTS